MTRRIKLDKVDIIRSIGARNVLGGEDDDVVLIVDGKAGR
jgi:hypothetical protein